MLDEMVDEVLDKVVDKVVLGEMLDKVLDVMEEGLVQIKEGVVVEVDHTGDGGGIRDGIIIYGSVIGVIHMNTV